jgi:hypothetical protein
VRFSWRAELWTAVGAALVIAALSAALVASLRSLRRAAARGAEGSRPAAAMWLMLVGGLAIFVLSNFGIDATGRYLLPLAVPLAVLTAHGMVSMPVSSAATLRGGSAWRWLALATLLTVNGLGTLTALRSVPPGLTPQFDAVTHIADGHDAALIDFLQRQGGYGYATYWITYRIAFLSHETVILSPQLPYKSSLQFTPADRYSAYTERVRLAMRPVLVTANLPALDAAVAARLTQAGVTYEVAAIGPYRVYYGLSARVDPAGLGLQALDVPAS